MKTSPAKSETHTPTRPWKDVMIWVVGGLFSLTVGVNLVMVWIAVGTKPDLVAPDYYEAAKNHDRKQELEWASDQLKWKTRITVEKNGTVSLNLRVVDETGLPVTGLKGNAVAYRPSDASLDQTLTWRQDARIPGTYRALLRKPASGFWRIKLDLSRNGQRLYKEISAVLP